MSNLKKIIIAFLIIQANALLFVAIDFGITNGFDTKVPIWMESWAIINIAAIICVVIGIIYYLWD